jgi:hypothetical protein
MPSSGLRDLCLELIVGSADRFLDLQWSDGRFATEPEHDTDEWCFFDQQYILPAALLYVTEHPANPWYRSPRLWEAILRNNRHIEGRIAADGSMTWRLGGVVLPNPFVCQRLTASWLVAHRLLREYLSDQEAARWQAGILRACQWIVKRKLLPHRHVVRFRAHDVGTGTNHFSLYLSLIWLAGREFGRPEWVALATDLMGRLIADQRPGGYWEEHHGPALGYNYLTFHGVHEYAAWSGDVTARRSLRAGLDLHQHWTCPDGIPVECVDGRMRRLPQPVMWGLAGFALWPEGRGYARLLLERLREHQRDCSGETIARLAAAYLLIEEGDESPPPQAQAAYRAELDDASVIRKQGPWVVALSGQCSPPWPDNQYFLDRQALLSLWREGTGAVFDGSNSKHQPELATFSRPVADGADHMPLRARLLPADDGAETLEVVYRTFRAAVRARILDAKRLEFSFEADAIDPGPPVTLTLVPHVSYNESLDIEGRGRLTLGDDALDLHDPALPGSLVFRGVRLRLPQGARLRYPVSPFNSYSADNTSPPSANRMVVSCPLGDQAITCLVEALA